MRNHVWRPLYAAIALVILILTVRHYLVPKDFGVQGESFTFNFYRASSVDEWKKFPLSYKGSASCEECHEENVKSIAQSKHGVIACENCHGPLLDHPDDPELLPVNKEIDLCLRCHMSLPYPGSLRGKLAAIDPEEHNRGDRCVECHNPHNPNLEDM